MPLFKITVSYDGTDFVGWQRQANGVSVQGLIEEALSELDGRAVAVAGAGRTDAGVHALGQVAGFSLQRTIAADAVLRALNARLPHAIRVVDAGETDERFHPRFSAQAKRYCYRIWNAPVANPFERRYAWHVQDPLDIDAMNAAARLIVGCHDFAAFAASGSAVTTAERTIVDSAVGRPIVGDRSAITGSISGDSLITYDVSGSGFLRHMVRTIVGTLVEIGRSRHEAEWIAHVLASRSREAAGPTAPATGLFLVAVDY